METTATKNNLKEFIQSQKEFFQLPKVGDIVKGKALGKESGVLYVDLGIVGTGVVYGAEYFRAQEEIKNISPGDEISAKIVELENDEGFRELSLKKAEEEKNWQYLENKLSNKEAVEVKITDANKGGLMVKVGSVAGFLPVSQLSPQNYPRVEGGDKNKILIELKKFIGKT
ncbi:MAG: S1 RNA-binding domain-containing protein, partial [Candidatus Spechtbacterales bacterium]